MQEFHKVKANNVSFCMNIRSAFSAVARIGVSNTAQRCDPHAESLPADQLHSFVASAEHHAYIKGNSKLSLAYLRAGVGVTS
jgi:hypothetical protein